MYISVIIPVVNEAEHLLRRTAELEKVEGVEVIIVDGGSTDGSLAVASGRNMKLVQAPAGRGKQMNAGAAAATGDILLFLHVDTVLPKGFHDIVRRAVEERGAIGGCFSFALDGKRAFYRFIEKTANFRSRRMGVVFGDQAIFVRKEAFFEAGGYPLLPVMEDSALVDGIRKKGSFVQLEERAVTSARRWERSGALRTTLVNVLITWAWRLGVAPARLKRWYEVLAGGRS